MENRKYVNHGDLLLHILFGRGYFPEVFREIAAYFPEDIREIVAYFLEDFREIVAYFPEEGRGVRIKGDLAWGWGL